MRFTAPEKAGNPDADFVGRALNGFEVIVEKGVEVLFELFCDYVLNKLLLKAVFIVLRDLDNTVDRTVDVALEHTLYFH